MLVVDDDQLIRKLLSRVLKRKGYVVTAAEDGSCVEKLLDTQTFDLILTDVQMPKMDGMEVLRLVRKRDPDLPVILFTASPTTNSAIGALQLRATAYLTKPIDPGRLIEEVDKALKLYELARVRREANRITQSGTLASRAEMNDQFDRALSSLFMLYQPIIRWSTREVYGSEALVRCKEPAFPHPGALFDAAAKLERWDDLGRLIRVKSIEPIDRLEKSSSLFLNLHPRELLDEMLYDPRSALAAASSRIVLEITERAHLETVPDVERRINDLRAIGFRVAIDDIGAGYSGLTSFTMLRPDLVKIDMALVRDIDKDPVKRRLAAMLIQLCIDLGIGVVAEGVETPNERDTLIELNCDLLQGYLFGRPSPPFLSPNYTAT